MTLTETRTTPKPDARQRCGTCDWLAERTDTERETFAWMAAQARRPGPEWTILRMLDEIKADGYPLQYAALNRHLLGYYGCGTR